MLTAQLVSEQESILLSVRPHIILYHVLSPGERTERQHPSGSIPTLSHLLGPPQIPTAPQHSAANSRRALAAAASACSSRCPCSLLPSCWASGYTCLQILAWLQVSMWLLQAPASSVSLLVWDLGAPYLKVGGNFPHACITASRSLCHAHMMHDSPMLHPPAFMAMVFPKDLLPPA